MRIQDRIVCDFCYLLIADSPHATTLIFGRDGSKDSDYRHWHRRDNVDCYDKHLEEMRNK